MVSYYMKNIQNLTKLFIVSLLFWSCTTSPKIIRMAEKGNSQAVINILREGSDVNVKDKWGDTALTKAANEGHVDIVKILIDEGADVNAKTNWGHTALTRAAWQGHIDVVKILIEKGADVNAITDKKDTALTIAAYRGHVDIVKTLIDNNAYIEMKNSGGNTALALAAWQGHSEIVKILLDKGAYMSTENIRGTTALELASSNKHDDIVEMLTPRFYGFNGTKKRSSENKFTKLIIKRGHTDLSEPLFEIRIDDLNFKEWNKKKLNWRPSSSLDKHYSCDVLVDVKHKIYVLFDGKLIKSITSTKSDYYPNLPYTITTKYILVEGTGVMIEFIPEIKNEYVLNISMDNSRGKMKAATLTTNRYPENFQSGSIYLQLIEKGKDNDKTIGWSYGKLNWR